MICQARHSLSRFALLASGASAAVLASRISTSAPPPRQPCSHADARTHGVRWRRCSHTADPPHSLRWWRSDVLANQCSSARLAAQAVRPYRVDRPPPSPHSFSPCLQYCYWRWLGGGRARNLACRYRCPSALAPRIAVPLLVGYKAFSVRTGAMQVPWLGTRARTRTRTRA